MTLGSQTAVSEACKGAVEARDERDTHACRPHFSSYQEGPAVQGGLSGPRPAADGQSAKQASAATMQAMPSSSTRLREATEALARTPMGAASTACGGMACGSRG